jgi:hypothetical protein
VISDYDELRVRFAGDDGAYEVFVNGDGGEASGHFSLPFSNTELENIVLRLGAARSGVRELNSPEMALAEDFGRRLFGAVFQERVRDLYLTSTTRAKAGGRGLRLTLSLSDTPALMHLPWEYLYDDPDFLCTREASPIVRYVDLPSPPKPLRIELPLRILALVSSPLDAPQLDVLKERRTLEQAVKELTRVRGVEITWLKRATLLALFNELKERDYHVFHYIGHGGFDKDADTGVLLLENEHRLGDRVSGQRLATVLANHTSLRLAVLNACEGARTSRRDPFAGVAASLVRREFPAVIAMQFEITDRAAILFAGQFYERLARGYTVDAALAWARLAIFADENDIEWGTPVLLMRAPDGRIFDVPEPLEDDGNRLSKLLARLRRWSVKTRRSRLLAAALGATAFAGLVAFLLMRGGGATSPSPQKLTWTLQRVTSNKLPGLQKIRAVTALPDKTPVAVGSDSSQLPPLFLSNAGQGWTRQPPRSVDEPTRRQILTSLAVDRTTVVAVGWEGTKNRDAAIWIRNIAGEAWARVCIDETVCGDRFPGGGSSWQMIWSVTGLRDGGFVAVGADTIDGSLDAAAWYSTDGSSWYRARQAPDLGGERNQELRALIETRKGPLLAVGSDKSEGAVWSSADGAEWTEEATLSPCRNCTKLILYGVAETPRDGVIAVGAETLKQSDRDQAVIWRRRQAGDWTRVETDLTSPGQRLLGVAAGSSGVTAVGYERRDGRAVATVWRSSRGLEWSKEEDEDSKFAGPGAREMTSVSVDPNGQVIVGGDVESRSAPGDNDQQDGAIWIGRAAVSSDQPTPPRTAEAR